MLSRESNNSEFDHTIKSKRLKGIQWRPNHYSFLQDLEEVVFQHSLLLSLDRRHRHLHSLIAICRLLQLSRPQWRGASVSPLKTKMNKKTVLISFSNRHYESERQNLFSSEVLIWHHYTTLLGTLHTEIMLNPKKHVIVITQYQLCHNYMLQDNWNNFHRQIVIYYSIYIPFHKIF